MGLPAVERAPSWLFAAAALGVFVGAVDQTAVVTVLPSVIADIDLPVRDFYRSSWIVNAYLLGYILALPIVGRVADIYGHGRIFALSLGVFVIGSALVAMAPTFGALVGARALQAAGGGGLVPVAMAIAVTGTRLQDRAGRIGLMAAAAEAGALLGPLWGGAIAEIAGWRWVFWVNVPLVAPIGIAMWRWERAPAAQRQQIDWPGTALLGGALALLTFALVDDPNEPRPLLGTAAMLLGAGALAACFWRRERVAASPLLPPAIFRERTVVAANVASVLLGAGLITALIGVPLFANLVLVESPFEGGLTLMRLTVAVPLGALAGGWMGTHVGLRATSVVGMLLAAAGFAGLRLWDRELSEAMRTLPQIAAGFGFGLVTAPIGAAVLERVSSELRATASAWVTLSRIIGMVIGASVLSSTGLGRFYARAAALDFRSPEFATLVNEAQVQTFHEVFTAAAAVMLVAALVAAGITGGERHRRPAS